MPAPSILHSPIVLSPRDGFEVIGPDAEPHTAEVVEFKVSRDWPDLVLVGPSMRAEGLVALVTGLPRSVSAVAYSAVPQPTAISLSNEVPEAYFRRLPIEPVRVAVSQPAEVVRVTPPSHANDTVTSINGALHCVSIHDSFASLKGN